MSETKTKTPHMEFENVGPIEKFAPDNWWPQGPGVAVLRGASGSGKSTALRAVKDLLAGKGKISVSVRDGERRGYVEAFGARITLTRARGKRAGAVEFHSIEGRYDIGVLIDPGHKDEAANDAKRIKALIDLSGVQPDLELFRHLVPDDAALEDVVATETAEAVDLIEMATRLKRDFEAVARQNEAAAENHTAAARAKLAVVEGIDPEAEADAEKLSAAYVEAVQAQARLKSADELAEKALAESVEAAKRLEQLRHDPDRIDSNTAKAELDAACSARADWECEVNALAGRVEELEALLRQAKAEHQQAQQQLDAKRQAERDAEKILQQANEFEELLEELEAKASTTAARVPLEELKAAAQAVEQARQAVEYGVRVRDARERHQEASKEMTQSENCQRRAAAWRDAASGIEEVLSDVVARLAPEGITVGYEDGKPRIFVEYDGRGRIPFCELSEGERCKLAVEIGVALTPEGGILTIDQPPWQGLQPKNRRLMDQLCRERGVYALTAQVDDGELRVGGVDDAV